ncbi:MAG: DNA-binding domain-containing protein [Bacteroidota bacterium]
MALKYSLLDNPLTTAEGDFRAQVQDRVVKDIDDIINLMIYRGSTVTKAEALSVIEEFSLAVAQFVSEGNNVNTDLFNISPSIRGVFAEVGEGFNRDKHNVNLNIRPGSRLRAAAEQITVEKVRRGQKVPLLDRFEDINSSVVNLVITPGGMATLTGSNLKFDPADAQQGIFFKPNEGVEVKATVIVRSKPSEVIFQIPQALSAGNYNVLLRTAGIMSADLREGTLPVLLTVGGQTGTATFQN